MQARAACCCPSCLSHVSSARVARRITGAALSGLPLPFPSSTFFFTTIFAAAMIADGRVKRDRRNMWDTAIEREKQDSKTIDARWGQMSGVLPEEVEEARTLANVQEDAPSFLEPAHAPEAIQGGNELDAVDTPVTNDDDRSSPLDNDIAGPHGWEQVYNRNSSSNDHPPSPWPPNLGPPLELDRLPPQSVYASDQDKRRAMEITWTPKKIRIMEISQLRLVLRVLIDSGLFDEPPACLDAYPEPIRSLVALDCKSLELLVSEANATLKSIKADEPWRTGYGDPRPPFTPFYSLDNDGHYRTIHRRFNINLRSLFDRYGAGKLPLKHLITQMGNELLTSPAPPNMHTYNILIVELARLRAPPLVDAVFDSLLEASIRPNEITCAALLTHYARRNSPREFVRLVELMRGRRRGLMLARPEVFIDDESAKRLVPKEDGRIIQKVYPTPMVFFRARARAAKVRRPDEGDDGGGGDGRGWVGVGRRGLVLVSEGVRLREEVGYWIGDLG